MKNVMAIVFTEDKSCDLGELTELRTLAAVPFAGRYRLIDFTLSNLSNSGVQTIGVTTCCKYYSLLEHMGNGKPWDLERKNSGLTVLPPNVISEVDLSAPKNQINILKGAESYLKHKRQEFVVLAEANTICNVDVRILVKFHLSNNADISMLVHGENDESMGIFILKKALLMELMEEHFSNNVCCNFIDVVNSKKNDLKVLFLNHNGYFKRITDLKSYYDANMDILKTEIRNELFWSINRIMTNVKDNIPTVHHRGSKCSNSLLSNGCIIRGEVSNSILFRGVKIGENEKVENCIVMKNMIINENGIVSRKEGQVQ